MIRFLNYRRLNSEHSYHFFLLLFSILSSLYGRDLFASHKALETKSNIWSRVHQIKSLFTVTPVNFQHFSANSGVEFSLLKYGSQAHIDEFSGMLLDLIWRNHGDQIRQNPADWKLVRPAYMNLPTSAVLVADSVRQQIFNRYGLNVDIVSLKRKSTNAIDFGSLSNMQERENYIHNSFYYKGPSLKNQKLLFIEDALVSGTHYKESQRSLVEDSKVNHKNIYAYFLLNVEQSGISSSDYSLEAKINHSYITKQNPERLLPILSDRDNRITPRMIKYIFTSKEFTEFFGKSLDYRSLLRIYQACIKDEFHHKKSFAMNMEILKNYLELKLTDLKKNWNVQALYQINESNISDILLTPRFIHSRFGHKLSLAGMFAMFRAGDGEATNFFARKLSRKIIEMSSDKNNRYRNHLSLLKQHQDDISDSSLRLTSEVAGILNLRTRTWDSGTKLIDSNGSGTNRQKRGEGSRQIKPANLFLGDVISQGGTVRALRELARSRNSELRPLLILDIQSESIDLEACLVNQWTGHLSLKKISEALSEANSAILLENIKILNRLESDQMKELFSHLTVSTLYEIYNCMVREGLDTMPESRLAFRVLTDYMRSTRSQYEGCQSGICESLVILDSANIDKFVQNDLNGFVRFRLGHSDALNRYADELIRRIQTIEGEGVSEHPDQFVVASPAYYHGSGSVPYLADIVAQRLKVRRVDLRFWNHGLEKNLHKENSDASKGGVRSSVFVSNPNVLKNRKVLFITDLISSDHEFVSYFKLLKEEGAKSIDGVGIVELIDIKPSWFQSLVKERIKQPDSEFLSEWVTHSEMPVFTDIAEICLSFSEEIFAKIVKQFSKDRVWDMWHLAQSQRYETFSPFKRNLKLLEKMALEKHLEDHNYLKGIAEIQPRLLFVDLDETLTKTLTPLSSQVVRDLSLFLHSGGYLVVASMQPIGSRGMSEYLYQPMYEYLSKLGRQDLLHQIWLMPAGGTSGYRPDHAGLLHTDDPEFQTSITKKDFEVLSQKVQALTKGLYSKLFERGAYLSLHFSDETRLLQASQKLQEEFDSEGRFEVVRKKAVDTRKQVLHVKPVDLSKINARQFVLQNVKRTIFLESGRPVSLEDIVTAGDKMGNEPDNNDDTGIFIMGAQNFALGQDACAGARTDFLNQFSVGFTGWLHQMAARSSIRSEGV